MLTESRLPFGVLAMCDIVGNNRKAAVTAAGLALRTCMAKFSSGKI